MTLGEAHRQLVGIPIIFEVYLKNMVIRVWVSKVDSRASLH
jgi:hypothetical protein